MSKSPRRCHDALPVNTFLANLRRRVTVKESRARRARRSRTAPKVTGSVRRRKLLTGARVVGSVAGPTPLASRRRLRRMAPGLVAAPALLGFTLTAERSASAPDWARKAPPPASQDLRSKPHSLRRVTGRKRPRSSFSSTRLAR
jgi:hypothetical protein